MTLTLPTYVASGFAGTAADFRNVKRDTSGAVRANRFSTAITAAAASDVLVGLVPFQKGARLAGMPILHVSDLDTDSDLTLDFGWTYYDSTLGTSDPNGLCSAVTTGQTGGLVSIDEEEMIDWVAEADGWITMTIGTGGTSYTTGIVKGIIPLAYDGTV